MRELLVVLELEHELGFVSDYLVLVLLLMHLILVFPRYFRGVGGRQIMILL